VLDDGSRRAGGSALYSALQAARLGLRARVITRGVPAEIERLLAPHRHELELAIQPAPHTTTLRTFGSGAERSQRVLAWAGPIDAHVALDTAILHLAPVAREIPAEPPRERPPFVGLTPQGLVREWSQPDGHIAHVPPGSSAAREASALAAGCDAIVVSEHERASCTELIASASTAGALVAVTAGAAPNTIHTPDGYALELDVPALDAPLEDLGAGDVFAAAFFIALSERRSPPDAVAFANAAAAVRMCGSGAGAIGGRAQIEARLSRVRPRR
jgi:pfkB family carbohydrate kinase